MGSDQIIPVLFFHGFWGRAADGKFLQQFGFKKNSLAVEYAKIQKLNSENYLSDWGSQFIDWKRQQWGDEPIEAVGYSQGGRLLLQAFEASPRDFKKLVLISTHPGLLNFQEKEQRLENDRHWAKKFRTLDWTQLQKEWDSQGVFHSKIGPSRIEAEYDRKILALCFENWSLAHQQNFRELINTNLDKIKIILGEEDAKYVKLYQEFLRDLSALKMEKGAAHRVPFDQPNRLVETLNSFF
jgi:2-succinyl-6-hydroxy-2,4-cyclohexadiene-1-carboxylate synthase